MVVGYEGRREGDLTCGDDSVVWQSWSRRCCVKSW